MQYGMRERFHKDLIVFGTDEGPNTTNSWVHDAIKICYMLAKYA